QTPEANIFNEIFRISKEQIVWGGNYFSEFLPSSQGWDIWNKGQRAFSLADGEMCWTSFDRAMRIFDYARGKFMSVRHGEHPTEKPVDLIKWQLEKSCKENDLIFDGFLGSGTTALACLKTNRRCIGVELDEDYFEIACKRIEKQLQSPTLFNGY
ncbi:site-specific DNA-methyltransferase, partial [Candidatus Bathyarchaeota archaeon]